MAAMSVIKNAAIFNFPKAFPQSPPPLPLSVSLRPKVSRVCLTSASKPSEGRIKAAGSDNKGYTASDSVKVAEDKAYEMNEKAKEVLKEGEDTTKAKTQEMKEKAAETAEYAKGKAKEGTQKVAETVDEVTEKTKETVGSGAEKAKEGTHKVQETAWSTGETVEDKIKGGISKAEEVAQTIEDQAKETTQKIKEIVIGKSEDAGH